MQTTIVRVTCDMCALKGLDVDAKSESPMRVAVANREVTIDLCQEHWFGLIDATGEFIDAGSPTSSTKIVRGSARARHEAQRNARRDPAELEAIRAWARENGFEVASRGRIARAVQEAYAAA